MVSEKVERNRLIKKLREKLNYLLDLITRDSSLKEIKSALVYLEKEIEKTEKVVLNTNIKQKTRKK